jgi:Predicted AAA-ATPase/PD-(D/E)XK nuclease superfamily
MKRKLLPIGIQEFRELRNKNCVYVDKTEYIHRLVTEGWYYFLSRPRRFGKSLLVSTLKELFSGSRELFEGLWIEDKWDWSQTNPVIQISFAKMPYQGLGLEKAISLELDKYGNKYDFTFSSDDIKVKFSELLQFLDAKHGKVVLLIDEYDKPIIDHLEQIKLPKAREHRDILKTFYSVLKDSESCLHFVLITGVSKFSQVSIFSDLNHLTDLTLLEDYALMLGYTQAEIEANFEDYLAESAVKLKMSHEELLKELRNMYNGFSWDGVNTVYNPFGVLNFFKAKAFRNFWFSTGTPTFLAELMKQEVKFDYENLHTNLNRLEKYDLDNLDIVALLFQTGYLTLTHLDPHSGSEVVLNYPNREIRESMYVFMLDYLKKRKSEGSAQEIVKDLALAFHQDDLERVKDLLESMFGDLPSNLYETDNKRSERFYHSFIHLTFKYLGIYAQSEVRTAKGRADSVVETPTHVYIFEFKHQETADAAFQQILDKNYAQKYVGLGKTVVGIGVNFDKKERIIDGWKVAVLK